MWAHPGPPGDHPWWVIFGGILPLLLFAVLIGLVVWAVLRMTGGGSPRPGAGQWTGPTPPRGPDAALEHARHRYARGEIGRDEFLMISHDLGGSASATPPPPAPATAEEPGT